MTQKHDTTHPEVPIHDRVKEIESGIILVNELQILSPALMDALFDRIDALSRNWAQFAIIVQFPNQILINAEVRARVKERILPIRERVVHVAAVVREALLLKLNFMFMAKLTGYKNYSFHQTIEEALVEVRKQLELKNKQN